MAMMAMTTSNSMRVNTDFRFIIIPFPVTTSMSFNNNNKKETGCQVVLLLHVDFEEKLANIFEYVGSGVVFFKIGVIL